MIECEIKLKIDNPEAIKKKLVSMGFIEGEVLTETDTYFDNKNNDVRMSDCALRIRETVNHNDGSHFCQINFKGKKYDNKSVTRPEFETGIENAAAVTSILNGLGFFPVTPQVIKTRQLLSSLDVNACIDTVDGLGHYLELESMAENEDEKESKLNKIIQILSDLGYSIDDTTTTSYLSKLQKRNK